MGIPKVHLVASPGFKGDISTSTTLNTTNRRRILLGSMVGAFMVIQLAWGRIPFSVIAIIVLSTFKIVFTFMALRAATVLKPFSQLGFLHMIFVGLTGFNWEILHLRKCSSTALRSRLV